MEPAGAEESNSRYRQCRDQVSVSGSGRNSHEAIVTDIDKVGRLNDNNRDA